MKVTSSALPFRESLDRGTWSGDSCGFALGLAGFILRAFWKKEGFHIHNHFLWQHVGETHRCVNTRLTTWQGFRWTCNGPEQFYHSLCRFCWETGNTNSFCQLFSLSETHKSHWQKASEIFTTKLQRQDVKQVVPIYSSLLLIDECMMKTHSIFLSSFTFDLIQLLSFSRDAFFLLSSTAFVELVLEVVPVFNKKD